MAHDTREMRLGLSGPLYQTRPRVVLGKSRRSKSLHVVFGAIGYNKKRFGQRTLRRNNESKKSCNHPNRLNLLTLTAYGDARSNFLRKIRVRVISTRSGGYAIDRGRRTGDRRSVSYRRF